MSRTVWIDGAKHALTALIGQGGEAEVYDLGDGRVVKWWKPADHADFAGQPDAQAAAAARLLERPGKLRALPASLPREVVAPQGLALAGARSSQVVGFVMPKVQGTPLHAYGEPRWRRDHAVDGNDVVAALRALAAAITRLHAAGVVIGDCNDLNVLVDGRAVHLIDVDSYQYGGFACPMFSERFVDPRLCDGALVPARPHDPDSDWFAFAVMAFRTLFGVSPWGGVSKRCAGAARVLRRISAYADDVTLPRAARPLAIVPDELHAAFRAIFERDQRGPFPRALLERLRMRRCSACGDEHARDRCPTCRHAPAPVAVHGRLHFQTIAPPAPASYEVTATTPIYFQGPALMRATAIGPERIGGVLAGLTRAWVGAQLGVGFYRAGGYAVGFVFRPGRGGLDDRIPLTVRGALVDAHATIGDDRAWLWLTRAEAGRIVTTCVVIGADARVLASTELADAPWLAGVSGACAAGELLFVPTDEGVARIELVAGQLAHTRTFPETQPLVAAGDRLALHPTGLDAVRLRDAVRMYLT